MFSTTSPRALATLLAGSLYAATTASAKSVFVHYMVQGITEGSGHAETDIDQARDLGVDAFALNIGAPSDDWAKGAIKQLFDYADTTDFKLFFSLDFYQTGDVNEYTKLVQDYVGRDSYLNAGPNSYPVISTFSTGMLGPEDFDTWKWDALADKVYFLPNADATPGYDEPSSWFDSWGETVDGVFGWETGWPSGNGKKENVSDSFDLEVMGAAHDNGKTYMAPLSSLQFKDCCGENYYRIGEVNLPQRMTQLLSMDPDFVEVISWNDGGESHYIGNFWPEAQTDDTITAYANTDDWPHYGWQPLIASFIKAYKDGADPSGMRPQGGNDAVAVGAMWYRPILKDADCNKPNNWEAAVDAVNYAVVVGDSAQDLSVRVTSGGDVIQETSLTSGLNYASVPGIKEGAQKIEVVKGGETVMTAASKKDVSSSSDNCFFNFQVVGLGEE